MDYNTASVTFSTVMSPVREIETALYLTNSRIKLHLAIVHDSFYADKASLCPVLVILIDNNVRRRMDEIKIALAHPKVMCTWCEVGTYSSPFPLFCLLFSKCHSSPVVPSSSSIVAAAK